MITTLEEFLEVVPKTGWYLTGPGLIRRGEVRTCKYECPISSLASKPVSEFQAVYYWDEGPLIERSLGTKIWEAADNLGSCDKNIRKQLLKVLKPYDYLDSVIT